MWVCPCRQDWQTLRPATTHLVIHAVSESFEWDDRSISALPRLEALTLIATDGRQVIGNMGLELPDPGAASMYNDLYVHSLPGRTSQPSALPLRDIGVLLTVSMLARLPKSVLVSTQTLTGSFPLTVMVLRDGKGYGTTRAWPVRVVKMQGIHEEICC